MCKVQEDCGLGNAVANRNVIRCLGENIYHSVVDIL